MPATRGGQLEDEVDDITAGMCPTDRTMFEVEIVWDIHRDAEDIIMIRVMQLPRDGTESPAPHYWTLATFKGRLEMMRDRFDQFHPKGD